MKVDETAEKIKNMEIRGASDIAKATAEALRNKANEIETNDPKEAYRELKAASNKLLDARPTAVSLPNSIRKVLHGLEETDSVNGIKKKAKKNSNEFIDKISKAKEKIAEFGSKRIRDGDTILTHCNSQAVISILKQAKEQGKDITVYSTESRPLFQGRITAKQLIEENIDVVQIIDSAVRSYINDMDLVIVGADAIGANGAVANKIGTSQVALVAKEARVNFFVAAETYKFSPKTVSGELIEIEQRPSEEIWENPVNEEIEIKNPAFDFTPPDYIDNIITEIGLISPHMAYFVLKEEFDWKIKDVI